MTLDTRSLDLTRREQMQLLIGRAPRPPRQRRHRITTTRGRVAVWFRLATRNRKRPVRPVASRAREGSRSRPTAG
ncbi:MAG: hypothetical protein ACRDRA_08300, partial [Pseudonocardiaceae bacterium]